MQYVRKANPVSTEAVGIMLELGKFEINAEDFHGCTAVIWAALNNVNTEVMAMLIQAGADLNKRTTDKKSALNYAIANDNFALVRMLLDNESDPLQMTQWELNWVTPSLIERFAVDQMTRVWSIKHFAKLTQHKAKKIHVGPLRHILTFL